MTKRPSMTSLREQAQLTKMLMELIVRERHRDADYVLAILQTDAAEADRVPEGRNWLRPGEEPPKGRPVYEAAFRWCNSDFRR